MEFQIAEAIELIKTLAETENLTQSEALTTFVAEAGLDIEYASQLKAALYEAYTLQEMASDSLTKALYSVFVAGESGAEDIQEVETKETQEGTKYKVRVQDKASGSSYTRYATREKIAQLRANPNIASVELSDYGSDQDSDGQKTAAAKGGGMAKKDHDGDGKVESPSKEHAGAVHNAIQKKMGGKPDGQDTRKEETLWDKYLALREGKKQGYNDRLDDAEGAKHGKKKEQDEKDRRDESEAMEKKDGKHKFAGDKEMKESAHQDKEEAKHDEKLASKDEKEAEYDTKKGKSKRAKELDDDAKQDDADAAVDVRRESNSWTAYLALREAKKSKDEKEKAAKDGHAVALYKDQWKDRKIADYDKEHGKDERAKEMRADAGEDRKRMKELDPDWKHAKYATGEEKGKKNYKDKKKVDEAADMWMPTGTAGSGDMNKKIEAKLKKPLPMPPKPVKEDVFVEADIIDAGRENQGERENKKLDAKGVDNSKRVHLMPKIREETIVTTKKTAAAISKLQQESSSKKETLAALAEKMGMDLKHEKEEKKEQSDRDKIRKMLDKEDEAEGKKDKCETVELDAAGMPIMEYSRNMANGPKADDVDPPADQNGDRGFKNPKGKAKRPRGGDRRPNVKGGPEMPFDDGTVPNGAGV